ncbi:hypothetical protein NHX12_021134 [Muraenolepis orangiensis]|uniref:Uncharacterized protein n=1 Tax=Muraenolepis orangiensis TaxID=630683 RepID=A0A9Q0ESY5_9TELE|nr:hypothetical protein NHX12_021134 [Muraenolepis orangiensis]
MYFNRSKKIHSEGEQFVLTTIRQDSSELPAAATMRARLTDRFDKRESTPETSLDGALAPPTPPSPLTWRAHVGPP